MVKTIVLCDWCGKEVDQHTPIIVAGFRIRKMKAGIYAGMNSDTAHLEDVHNGAYCSEKCVLDAVQRKLEG